MAVNQTSTGNLQIFSRPFSSWVTGRRKEGMDQWLLAVTSDPAAKGSAKDLEAADADSIH